MDHVLSEFPIAPEGKTDQPCLVVPSREIVRLYNQAHPSGREYKTVRKSLKVWFTNTAKSAGWTKVNYYLEYQAPRSYAALLIHKATDRLSP